MRCISVARRSSRSADRSASLVIPLCLQGLSFLSVRPVLCLAVLILSFAARTQEAEPQPGPNENAYRENVEEATRRVKTLFRGLNVDAMMEFYRSNFPGTTGEFEQACRENPTEACDRLKEMARRYVRLEQYRRRNPEEYKRLLELEQMESRSRLLGKRIQALTGMIEAKEGDPVRLTVDREDAMKELMKAVRDAFDMAQQNQLIEINRLEAEVRELRRFLDERGDNRDLILRQRFQDLSGAGWPEGEEIGDP